LRIVKKVVYRIVRTMMHVASGTSRLAIVTVATVVVVRRNMNISVWHGRRCVRIIDRATRTGFLDRRGGKSGRCIQGRVSGLLTLGRTT
jgi:hypothetical protein